MLYNRPKHFTLSLEVDNISTFRFSSSRFSFAEEFLKIFVAISLLTLFNQEKKRCSVCKIHFTIHKVRRLLKAWHIEFCYALFVFNNPGLGHNSNHAFFRDD